ncbi:hypothetical protein UMZ34_04145 [Halopseudomonas pachastrellae]|nr:hypothetical protein UMZ34_04145 [Halopseudomonas pachastrellae]
MQLVAGHSKAGSQVALRFEMDTLVVLHSCPHPLSSADQLPLHAGAHRAEPGRAGQR